MKRPAVVTYQNGELTPGQLALANTRTRLLLAHWAWMDYDLGHLLRSCYLQGARDMAQVVIDHPGLLDSLDAADYQI